MSGSISLSLSQQFDSTGAPLNGGLLYFYAAGTTTPQSAYQDTALTIPWPNPIVLDSAGRIPAFYLADGQIKIRLADANGVTQVSADNLLVVGASSGSGSAPSVDATTVLQTGDVKLRYGTGAHTGWVRAAGRTIGSATSGASERANSDVQSLFEYLWGADTNLSVSTGRGVSANADWVANKTLTLPDCRGRAIAGLDDMGNSAASRLTSFWFGTAATTLGAVGGAEKNNLSSTTQLPQFTPSGTIDPPTVGSLGGGQAIAAANGSVSATIAGAGSPNVYPANQMGVISSGAFHGTAVGSLTPSGFTTTQPTILMTTYIKL